MVYLETVPAVDEMFENMAWEKTSQTEKETRKKRRFLPKEFMRTLRRPLNGQRKSIPQLLDKYIQKGRVMDIGCGDAAHLMHLSEAYELYGIEISKGLYEQAQANTTNRAGNMINADALSGLEAQKTSFFDCIVMRSFLEHDIQPLPILAACARTLKPGGLAIIKVPNYGCLNRKVSGKNWCGFRFPDHVNYFTPETLTAMASRAGLDIARFSLRDRLPISDNMWLFLRKPSVNQ